MTTAFILDIIPTRMQEMGFCTAYRLEHRTFMVSGSTTLTIRAWNSWAWFPSEAITSTVKLTIESNFGILSTTGTQYAERKYEHTGKITIRNHDAFAAHVTMIVATPHHKPKG